MLIKNVWVLLVVFSLIGALGTAGAAAIPENAAAGLRDVAPGTPLVVKLHKGLGKPVKGAFAGADAFGLTIATSETQQRVIPWESVRKVRRPKKRTGLFYGLAVGAALAGATAAGADTGPGWTAAWIGIGSGTVGSLGGGLDNAEPPIYEAPKGRE